MTRNFGPPFSFGALMLQSNPADYGNPAVRSVAPLPSLTRYITVPGFAHLRDRRFPVNRAGMEAAEQYIRRVLEARGCPSPQAALFRGDNACMELYRLLRQVQSSPAGYGSPDAGEVKKGLAGAGAAGFGIIGAVIGAGIGSSIRVRGKPLKDGWLYGSMAGFLLPVILLAPKKEEAV